MPSASRTIYIDRAAAEVFTFFTTPTNEMTWRTSVLEFSSDGPVTAGARIHQRVAGPGGRSIEADIEVTAYEPNSRYAFAGVAGPVRPVGEYRFVEAGGGTDVTFSLTAEVGGLKKLVMSGPVQKSMDGEMASLDRAKAALES